MKKKKLEYLKQLKAADLHIRDMDAAIANISSQTGKPLVGYITFEERIGKLVYYLQRIISGQLLH